ncbi:MAG: hypothetical protein WC736_07550 [Gallionella sp.]
MPSMPGLLRDVRYVNGNVAQETAQTKAASMKKSSTHVEGENKAGLVTGADAKSEGERLRRRSASSVDRRKVCRRILRQRVLLEFRSGACRRRRHLREDDMLMHVSIKI